MGGVDTPIYGRIVDWGVNLNIMNRRTAPVALALALMLVAWAAGAAAFERRDGCFAVDRRCPAPVAFRSGRNPGAVEVAPGERWPLEGINRARNPSHARLRIAGADPTARWVALACGRITATCDAGGAAILAVNWQPAFCELNRHARDCRGQTGRRFDARNFALHGLWPASDDRAYCGVDPASAAHDRAGRWGRLAPLTLSATTRDRLARVMPGSQVHLHRHEWTKHGRCFDITPEQYFTVALDLIDQLNASAVRDTVVGALGTTLAAAELRRAADRAFGAGAGRRITVRCARIGDRTLITGLRVHLRGVFDPGARDLGRLMVASPPAPRGCGGGEIDIAG